MPPRSLSVRSRWVSAWLVPLLVACAPESSAELLGVSGVQPERLEVGQRFRVRGAGFPTGRDARVRIEGTLHAPAREPREVSAELRASVVSAEVVEASIDEALLAALGGWGTLHGRAVVGVASAGGGEVVGRSRPLTLEVAGARSLERDLEERRAGSELAEQLGLDLGEPAPDEAGLGIEAVAPGSVAARAGLVATDVIVSASGVRLRGVGDLAPAPSASTTLLEVRRVGEAARFQVQLPLPRTSGVPAEAGLWLPIAIGWGMLVLLLWSPLASVAHGVGSALRPGSWTRRDAVVLGAASVAFAGCALALPRLSPSAPVDLVLVLIVALRLAAAGLSSSGAWRARVLDVAGAGLAGLAIFVALGSTAALAGSTSVGALSDTQGSLPWEWAATRTPAGALGLLLLLAAGRPRVAREGGLFAVLDLGVTAALAALGALVLLGGTHGPSPALGAALFAVKALALFALMLADPRRNPGARGPLVLLGLSAATSVATLLWVLASPEPAVQDLASRSVLVAAGVLALAVLVHFAQPPRRLAPLHPYL